MAEKWRLLNDETPQTGAYNMALDQALAESAAESGGVTLRFGRFAPSCVSIGDSQRIDKFAKGDYDLVRRLTGGWAVLHTPDDLYYSVAASENAIDPDTLYERVHKAIATALTGMGLTGIQQNDASLGWADAAQKLVCFDSAGGAEVLWNGRKLFASATEHSFGYVVLQGIFPLASSHADIVPIVIDATARAEAQTKLADKAATLASALGVGKGDSKLGWASLTGAIGNAIAVEFGVELQPGVLTKGENTRTAELIETRYANDEWTLKR